MVEAIVVGLIVLTIGDFFAIYVRPKIEQNVTNDAVPIVDIHDTWTVVHKGDPVEGDRLEASWQLTVNMEQNGTDVTGVANGTCTKGEAQGRKVEYDVRGSFVNNILRVSFVDTDEASSNVSVFLLQIVGHGSSLEGYRLFLGRKTNNVRAIACEWVRPSGALTECGTA